MFDSVFNVHKPIKMKARTGHPVMAAQLSMENIDRLSKLTGRSITYESVRGGSMMKNGLLWYKGKKIVFGDWLVFDTVSSDVAICRDFDFQTFIRFWSTKPSPERIIR